MFEEQPQERTRLQGGSQRRRQKWKVLTNTVTNTAMSTRTDMPTSTPTGMWFIRTSMSTQEAQPVTLTNILALTVLTSMSISVTRLKSTSMPTRKRRGHSGISYQQLWIEVSLKRI
jgi:hypothetical protein